MDDEAHMTPTDQFPLQLTKAQSTDEEDVIWLTPLACKWMVASSMQQNRQFFLVSSQCRTSVAILT